MRLINIFGIIIITSSAFGLFQVKHYVQNLKKDLIEISKQIDQEKESIHILKAEWTHLNKPERLRNIVAKHLNLEKVKINQINKLTNKLPQILSENIDIEDSKLKDNIIDKKTHKYENIYVKKSPEIKLVKNKSYRKNKSNIKTVKW